MLFLLQFSLGLLLFLCSAALPASAQSKQLIPRAAPMAPEYLLGPGDQLVLHVVDMDEISDKPFRIDASGFLDLPLIGRVEAAGLSTEQFKAILAAKLGRYIHDPQIAVNLTDNQNRTVSVIGAVNSPGLRTLQGPRHLLDVLSEAGGTRTDAGAKVILTRDLRWGTLPLATAHPDPTQRYTTATLSLPDLLSARDPANNILIEPGDVVSVPKEEIVYVLGSVKRAGGFPMSSRDSISVLKALTLAEGTDHDAAPNRARILRPRPGNDGHPEEIPVDLSRVLKNQDADVPLFADDILYVPNSSVKATSRRAAEAVLQVATGVIIYRR